MKEFFPHGLSVFVTSFMYHTFNVEEKRKTLCVFSIVSSIFWPSTSDLRFWSNQCYKRNLCHSSALEAFLKLSLDKDSESLAFFRYW